MVTLFIGKKKMVIIITTITLVVWYLYPSIHAHGLKKSGVFSLRNSYFKMIYCVLRYNSDTVIFTTTT